MLVGEAPGYYEEQAGVPFVGPSGQIVDRCLEKAGIDPSETYKTNVVKIRPPNNEIFRLKELGTKVEDFLPQLWEEVDAIKPNCILAIGNTALKALTGETGIKNFRGSILPNSRTGLPKVVPTIHPASLMHGGDMLSWKELHIIQFDFKRAAEQSLSREYCAPQRTLITAKSSLDLVRFFDRAMPKKELVYDIETFRAIPMCIGFSFSRHEAISVPLLDIASPQNADGIPMHDMVFLWQTIADILLDSQYNLIGQNLKFDQGRLTDIGLETNTPYFDTQLGFHTLYSELPKKLGFISSILTEEPYYKDELEEYNPKKDKLNKRLTYNARDCAVTFEVYEEIKKQLEEVQMLDFFFEKIMPLHKFYFNMERRGIKIDLEERKRLIKKYERYTGVVHRAIEHDLGFDLNVNSPKQVGAAIYGHLKCPIRKDTGEETLEMLMLNAVKDERRRRILGNILKERKSRKTTSTYLKSNLSSNSRATTVVNITGTESGRTSTSKPKAPVVAEPEGFAFQTLTKHGDVGSDLRRMFVPDPGKCFIECDGSQAEDRVVCNLARDDEGLAILNKKEFKYNKFGIKDDRHTLTAMMILNLDFEIIDDEMRQLGKRIRHAGNYMMGKRRLSMLAGISEYRAGKCLDIFHAQNPKISQVFWEEIKQALQDNDQVLYSPHGRRRQFLDRWGEDLWKEAFSYIPQATVSDHTKFTAVWISERYPWIEFLMESHDSFLAQIPIERIDETARIFKEEYEKPIDFSRCSLQRGELIIPAEIQIGRKNWKEMEKYKLVK